MHLISRPVCKSSGRTNRWRRKAKQLFFPAYDGTELVRSFGAPQRTNPRRGYFRPTGYFRPPATAYGLLTLKKTYIQSFRQKQCNIAGPVLGRLCRLLLAYARIAVWAAPQCLACEPRCTDDAPGLNTQDPLK